MVGSRSWFVYTTDGGTNFAINLDKSNTQAVNPSGAGNAGLPAVALPRNITPRYALFSSADGLTRRKVILLTPTDAAGITPTTTFTPQGTAVVVTVTQIKGEAVRLPKLADTGLTT